MPGPGAYDSSAQRSITSILKSNSDKPQPAFRSASRRFPGQLGRQGGRERPLRPCSAGSCCLARGLVGG